jgi:hypothetical protein
MTNEEIAIEKDKMFAQIKSAEDRLYELRQICKHEKTFECDYSFRIGNISRANLCTYCGEFISFVNE